MKKIYKYKMILISIISTFIIIFNVNNTYAHENSIRVSRTTIDQIMSSAESFINIGKNTTNMDVTVLQEITDIFYNIMLGVGIVVAIIIGIVLGVKFMSEGTQSKAEVKEALIPYVVGCAVVFGAFIIWKIVIMILS